MSNLLQDKKFQLCTASKIFLAGGVFQAVWSRRHAAIALSFPYLSEKTKKNVKRKRGAKQDNKRLRLIWLVRGQSRGKVTGTVYMPRFKG